MNDSRYLLVPSLLIFALLTCAGSRSAFAANECQVKYWYASSFSQTSSATVNVDAGATKSINVSNVLYVQNLKSHKVRVYRSGFGSYVELSLNGRDPSVGNYIGSVTLQKVECVGGSSGTTTSYQTPAAMIAGMKAAGSSLSAIISAVSATFNVGGQQMAELLKAAGYDAAQMASPLKSAFNASGQQIAQWLAQAGFLALDVAKAVKSTFNASGQQVGQWLKAAGYSATLAANGLKGAFSATGQQVALWLQQAGFTVAQVADALKSSFNANATQAAQWLLQAGFSLTQTAQALKDQFSASAQTAINALTSVNCGVAACPTNQLASILKDQFSQTAAQAAATLKQAGYTATQIALAVKSAYGVTAQQLAALLKAAQYDAGQVAAAVKAAFTAATGGEVAQWLQQAGFSVAQVANALKSSFNANATQAAQWLLQAEFSLTQTAQALKDQFNASAQTAINTLTSVNCGVAGCPTNQLATILKDLFSQTAAQAAATLKQAGYTATQIALAVKSAYSVTAQQLAALLKTAQFDAGQVTAALKAAFTAATGVEVAQWLKQAGYSLEQIAGALRDPATFNATAEQMAQWLKQAGYTINDVATALKNVGNATVQVAAAILQSLFNASTQALQSALEAAGYASAQIADALTPPVSITHVFVLNSVYGPTFSTGSVVPLYVSDVALEYRVHGEGLAGVSSISGLVAGSRHQIYSQTDDRLLLDIRVPATTRVGQRGTAIFTAGTSHHATMEWEVKEMPVSTIAGPAPAPARGAALPDLIPNTFVNELYKVGSGTTMDATFSTFTALEPFYNSPFCQGIPDGGVAADNMPTSNRREITVPDIRWGVENSSGIDVTQPFIVKLFYAGSEVMSERVSGLAGGQSQSFTYGRPQSTTTVAKVGPGSGCYHAGLPGEGWNDNGGYQVRVDTENSIPEASESNNVKAI